MIKKYLLTLFVFVSILIPVFFCNAAVVLTDNNFTLNELDLVATGLDKNVDVLFKLINSNTQTGTTSMVQTVNASDNTNGTVYANFYGLNPGGSYTASVSTGGTEMATYNKTLPGVLLMNALKNSNNITTAPAATTATVSSKTAVPSVASKAGGLVPKCPDAGCGFPELIQLINNVISFLLFSIASPLAALAICYAGYLYLSSSSSEGNISKAKAILKNVVIGYIIALAAWLIVHSIVQSLGLDASINTFLSK